MSPRKRSHIKRRNEGLAVGKDLIIEHHKDVKDLHFVMSHRIKAEVIDSPPTRIMNYCISPGLLSPQNTSDTVWRGVDCCPEGKTDNNKKHWWNI
ncbi:MAG TPA: hypothetical protein ENI23_08910 [bacterium]|nr:hypothetical protein [bacterium]